MRTSARVGRHRAVEQVARQPWAVASAIAALVAGVCAAAFVLSPSGSAATASNFYKTGTDLTNGSTANSATGTVGSAVAGDTVRWALNYSSVVSQPASVNITDEITDGQTYRDGSLTLPPGFTGSVNGNQLVANGTVLPQTTEARSAPFDINVVDFTQSGGDGYTIEGFGKNIYTVYHHAIGEHVVYCSTLAGAVCAGWPGHASYVDPTSGTPLGTGASDAFATGSHNGSLIENGRLYWPVERMAPVNGGYPVGLQCLDLVSLESCGFIQLDTVTQAPVMANTTNYLSFIGGDGQRAADGDYYFMDGRGNLLCWDPAGGACGKTDVTGGAEIRYTYTQLQTYGRYVYSPYTPSGTSALALTCFDTSTDSVCPAYPILPIGPAEADVSSELLPILAADGGFVGGCTVYWFKCYDPAGNAIANPWANRIYGNNPATVGISSAQLIGSKVYTIAGGDHVGCFDFALPLDAAGHVQPCTEFTVSPTLGRGYTVRSLANLPGCMAADGDAGEIRLFDATTGEPCNSASQTMTLTPSDYYCDGQPGHASTWNAVTLTGLSATDYRIASLTLLGVDGNPVPGWQDVPFPDGSTTLDISPLPVSGNTAKLTAVVNLTGFADANTIAGGRIDLTWHGDPIQVCYETELPSVPCETTQPVSNTATALAAAGEVASPGQSSGAASFDVASSAADCMLHIVKAASAPTADPSDTITYTIVITNAGTQPYDQAHPAVVVDDISDVLLDATYNNDADATNGSLNTDVANGKIVWTGPLAPGDTVSITFSVTVRSPDTGDHSVVNRAYSPNPSNCAQGSDAVECAVTTTITEPNISVTKTSNPPDGSTVVAGQTITYTLTFANTGNGRGAIDYVDHLGDVLDDATVTSAPSASGSHLTVATIANEQLEITGTLPADTTEAVTYRVTVKPDGARGDNVAANFVVPQGVAPPQECVPQDPLCTRHAIPQIDDWKTVDPVSGTDVVPGQTLTYTLHFRNTGAAPGSVDRVDDISQALDDATVVSQPASSDPALEVTRFGANQRAHITGTLAAGQTVTITYQLKVRPAGELGDAVLANFLLNPSDDPPSSPACAPPDPAQPDCTTNPVGALHVTKSVDPKNFNEVESGDVLRYRLTFRDVGQARTDVDYTDDASDVLDDADLVSQPSASDPALTASTLSGGSFHVTGVLTGGQTVTVTYTVRVKPDAEQENQRLDNYLVATGDEAPGQCVSANPLCTENPVTAPSSGGSHGVGGVSGSRGGGSTGPTAKTGADTEVLLVLGASLLACGALLVAFGRRRLSRASG